MKIALTSESPDTYLQAGLSRVRVVKMVRGKYTSHGRSWKVGSHGGAMARRKSVVATAIHRRLKSKRESKTLVGPPRRRGPTCAALPQLDLAETPLRG